MRRISLVSLVAAAVLALPLGALAGVTGPAFFVDGELYRTVGTPTDFSDTGAPANSFDTIYQFSGAQRNVATAAPGDAGYNGGRWQVEVIGYAAGESYASALAALDADGSGALDFTAEVEAAIAAGVITTSPGPTFECPVIPLAANENG